MSTFAPTALPEVAPADPTKHVNYELGMVLGVDDFVQEFAYGSARDERIVRELIGYGVVWGLRVEIEVSSDGPRVSVAPGECVTPAGQFVSVSPTQCASLNDWVAANRDAIVQRFGSPPDTLELTVVAGYAEALTDNVPIPGEPCRSDDELQQPSRVQDCFSLELVLDAPRQDEDDGLRDFVAWVRAIPVADIPAGDVDAFIESVRAALDLQDASPPALVEELYGSPPPGLEIPRAAAARYLAALFAFWVSDLRERVRTPVPGAEGGGADDNRLRLAQLSVPLTQNEITGELLVADTPPVGVRMDAAARPALLHLKLLQEWVLADAERAAQRGIAVSGRFRADASTVAATGNLSAHQLADHTLYVLTFPGYASSSSYVVTGHPVAALADSPPSTFEVIPDSDPGLPAGTHGIVVRVRQAGGASPPAGGFMVRIEEP